MSNRILVREVAALRAEARSVTTHRILEAVADGYADRDAISARLEQAPDVSAVITALVTDGLLDAEWIENADPTTMSAALPDCVRSVGVDVALTIPSAGRGAADECNVHRGRRPGTARACVG